MSLSFLNQRSNIEHEPAASSQQHLLPRQASVASFLSTSSSSTFPATTSASFPANARTSFEGPPPEFPLTLNGRTAPASPSIGAGGGRRSGSSSGGPGTSQQQQEHNNQVDSDNRSVKGRKRVGSSIFGGFGRKASKAAINSSYNSDSNPPSPALHPTPRNNSNGSTNYFDQGPSSSKNIPSYYTSPKPPPPPLPSMPSFDDQAPMVPLSSKQAQLLGVGGPQQTLNIVGLMDGFGPTATPSPSRTSRASSPQRGGAGEVSMGTPTGSKFSASKGKGKSFEQQRGSEGSIKEKKKGALRNMRDLLTRKSSRADLRDGNMSDGHGEFTGGITPLFDNNVPLPPKLQARGDTADVLPMLASSKKGSKNGRKPTKSPTKAPTPQVRQPSMFAAGYGTGAITLDTNLDSMDGIIAPLPSSLNQSRSGSLSGASGQDVDGVLPSERNFSVAGSIPHSNSISHSLMSDPRRPSYATSHRPSETGIPFPSSSDGPPSTAGSGSRRYRENSGASTIGNSVTGFWQNPATAFGEAPLAGPSTSSQRPGMARASSTFSVNLASGLVISSDRRPSLGPTAATQPPVAPRDVAGAWTAPDSWAVKGDDPSLDHDSSDEEQDDQDEDGDSETGLSPMSRDAGVFGNSVDPGTPMLNGGRPGTSNGRPNTRAGRPGTADGYGRSAQRNFIVRILWGDANTATIPAPLTATAFDLITTLSRKFPNTSTGYSLYLREKGIERRMGPNEKPVLLQKRRFEQAGYTELDKLEELGREDNSYLCKLVYKATHAPPPAGREDDIGDSREFVDLSGRGVETIPICLYRYAHEMVTLNLSKNRPFDLPTDFVQLCSSLREVHLSHMGLKRLPQAIKECASLTRLDISNNHIVELEHIALDELSGLTSLKCHNNRLWMLPEYFSRFKVLKYINLSNNRFDTMPAVVCEITHLVELDISFNTITFLPPEIGQLVNVERLVLLANKFTSLPTTLSSLVRLRELDCRRNFIADLSPISDIPNLETLRTEYNQASVLDAHWSHMKTLNASNNSITRFALSGTGNCLTTLNLSNAKLSSLAVDMFEHLGSVEELIFDSNQIRVLPEGIGSLANLQTLSMKNNLLDVLPSTIGRLQRLQSLQISGNNLHELPAEIWLCSSLMTINASSNLLKDFAEVPMMSAPTVEPGLEELDARKLSTISKAPSTASGRVAPPLALSLQRLYLGDNRIIDDVFAPISLMTELRILNLSFNDIFEIPPSSLFKCQQLEELYLSGNKLTSLPPDDLERLVNLKLIYLNGNKLQTLPSELGKIKKLFALDVGSNVLKYNIANWPYDWNWNWNLELRYLNLSGNKRLEVKPGHQNDLSNLPLSAKRRNLADFSALTKLHILGLMDVTLMIPSLPDENEDRRVRTSTSEINDMGYGIADTLGSRVDALSLVDIVIPRFRSKDDEAIFGLFDAVTTGQKTGAKLVKYLQDSFTAVFTLELSRLKSGEVTSDALRRAFLNINRDYGNLLLPASDNRRKNSEISLSDRGSASIKSGASGIIVYIRRQKMYVANAGNALAVIAGRGGSARLIAKKHEPFDESEVARIRTAEGWISHRGFVNDEVDISRSFGFYNVFPAVNSSPNYEEIDLADTDEFVIIANRGLWEHMSYQTAVDVARTERNDPMAAAAKLRDLAISYGSAANIMVMVLAVRDLFKAKKDYRTQRAHGGPADEDNYYQATQSRAATRGRRQDEAGERYLNLLDREVAPPVGLVALVFTDIRNSTALWDTNAGMQTAIRFHNQLLRRQLRSIGGYEVKTEGDAFMVSFPTVTSALLWCLTCQLELLREDWPQEILDSEEGKEITNSRGELLYRGLSVRMGIHWGAPVCEADPITRRMDYFGPMVNRASRISAVAEGGQISASQDVIDIIQEVVMERKPAPSSLDSDSGEESDEEEWLDANEKRDVLALRRLGFGIAPIGERRLKGLETPEMLSLIYPTALKDRIKLPGDSNGQEIQAEVQEPSSSVLDITLIRALAKVVQRLESATSNLVHPPEPLLDPGSPIPADSALVLINNKRKTINPATLAVTVRPDATDEELTAVFESLLHRIENTLSTLVLHQMGPFAEVFAALGGAIKNDPKYIMNALSRYGALMSAA